MDANRIDEIIARVRPELHREDLAVLDAIHGASLAGESVTQLEIATSKLWLVLHPDLKKRMAAAVGMNGALDGALRQIRAIIRNLRLAHGVPIISGNKGYRLPGGEDEVKAYLKRMEHEAKARAWASLETYRGMSKILGTKSEFFEGMEKLHKQLELFGKKPQATLTLSRAKSPCPKCKGSGTHRSGDGVTMDCPKCKGSGIVADVPDSPLFKDATPGRATICLPGQAENEGQ